MLVSRKWTMANVLATLLLGRYYCFLRKGHSSLGQNRTVTDVRPILIWGLVRTLGPRAKPTWKQAQPGWSWATDMWAMSSWLWSVTGTRRTSWPVASHCITRLFLLIRISLAHFLRVKLPLHLSSRRRACRSFFFSLAITEYKHRRYTPTLWICTRTSSLYKYLKKTELAYFKINEINMGDSFFFFFFDKYITYHRK